jgi:putative membrane protein
MHQLTVIGLVFAVSILPATAQIDPAEPQSAPGLPAPNTANREDKVFAQLIAANYLAAVEFGKMASAKAHRNEVRQFARRLVLDQSKAIANLERLAKQAEIPISDSLGPVDVVIKQQLESLSGSAFDLAYVRDQLFTHHMAIMLLESQVRQGQDGAIQKLAAEFLPSVTTHLRMARELMDELAGVAIRVGVPETSHIVR